MCRCLEQNRTCSTLVHVYFYIFSTTYLLQLVTILTCVGVGVVIPLPFVIEGTLVVVVGGLNPMTLTQTYALAHIPEQSFFTEGFHFTKSARVIPFAVAMF